jgi:hypothetical protein
VTTSKSGTVNKLSSIPSAFLTYYLADSQSYDHINDKLLRATGFSNSREKCGGAAGKVRVTPFAGLKDTCWYAADWKKILQALSDKKIFSKDSLKDVIIHICDNDCNSLPLAGSLSVAKSRRIMEDPLLKTITVLPLNVARHFKARSEALRDSIPFDSKKPIAIWRGTTTGVNWNRLFNRTSNITATYGFDVDENTLRTWRDYDNDPSTQGSAR